MKKAYLHLKKPLGVGFSLQLRQSLLNSVNPEETYFYLDMTFTSTLIQQSPSIRHLPQPRYHAESRIPKTADSHHDSCLLLRSLQLALETNNTRTAVNTNTTKN